MLRNQNMENPNTLTQDHSSKIGEFNGLIVDPSHESHRPLIRTFRFWIGLLFLIAIAILITLYILSEATNAETPTNNTFINK